MTDELPHRIPGQALRLHGEIYPPDGGWFGHEGTAQPARTIRVGFAEVDQKLLERVLTGLHGLTGPELPGAAADTDVAPENPA